VEERAAGIARQHSALTAIADISRCRMAFIKAIPLDKAGRVVLPKDVRDKLRLEAGDELLVEETGEHIVLRPVRAQATLKKERGVWVYQSGQSAKPSTRSLQERIDAVREERIRELSK
jgi:AbrB family looped-hinge helix DNA binding protein